MFGYRRPTHRQGYLRKREFIYTAETAQYLCPQGQTLIYSTTSREGYRHYVSDPTVCRQCPLLSSCTQNAKQQKTVTRHVWEDSRERQDANRLTPWGKVIYQRRKETVERSFADAKELHQYRYARYRGRNKVQAQCLMTAAAQNIKKIALLAG